MVAMGDLSAEPSMEEILSSIKRIIAEEGEAPVRGRRMGRAAPSAPGPQPSMLAAAVDEVLELSDPMPATPAAAELTRRAEARAQGAMPPPSIEAAPPPAPEPEPAPAPRVASAAMAVDPLSDTAADPAPEPIASPKTVDASRGALDSLSRMLIKPEAGSDGTLEGMVREMLRPMLRDWLDRNLPPMVEDLVSREIARITRGG